MTSWPDGWQPEALRVAEIPATDFALQVLNLWQQATPTDRWTNNPLGMPAVGYASQQAFSTGYAAFPSMTAFYAAFKTAVHAKSGKPLFTALAAQDKLTAAWRAIHALGWPANLTETDYPATILDAVTDGSTAAMEASQPSARKSVGTASQRSDVHGAIQTTGRNLEQSAVNISGASRALYSQLGGVNRRGG